jgi:hypothetical protein
VASSHSEYSHSSPSSPSSPSLRDVSRALYSSLGLPITSEISLTPSQGIEILFLIDGLGAHSLVEYAQWAPNITSMASLGKLSSEFPSTTATSLTSVGTGLAPAEHGMLGYTVRIPYSDNRLLNALKWDSRVDPVIWQSHETLFERGKKSGINAFNISSERYAGTGFTEAALRGATFLGANTFDRMIEQLRFAMRSAPTFIYLYINDIDAAGHEFGVGSQEWIDALVLADDFVGILKENLPTGARLTLTADHGMLNAQEKILIDGDLIRDVTLIGGEPRARHIYVESGREKYVQSKWQEILGTRVEVLLKSQVLQSALFGANASPQSIERLGDLIAIPKDEIVLIEPARKHLEGAMVGHHGGLTEIERAIPLFSFQT